MEQLDDSQLVQRPGPDQNSVAILVWHLGGNLTSRFTDLLTSDGEKPWRRRDEEFAERTVELLAKKYGDHGSKPVFAAFKRHKKTIYCESHWSQKVHFHFKSTGIRSGSATTTPKSFSDILQPWNIT